jgi:hypothetical protein
MLAARMPAGSTPSSWPTRAPRRSRARSSSPAARPAGRRSSLRGRVPRPHLGALSVTTSNPNYQAGHGPLPARRAHRALPQRYRDHGGDEEAATAASLAALERLLAERSADRRGRVLIEPVLGEGGYVPAPLGFLRELRALCDEHGILLICDEIQSGYGRTGRMWAFEHAGIVPDVVCLAKAIANGLPLARSSRGASCTSAGAWARTARRSAATRSPARPPSPSSRRSSARAWWPTPRSAASS